MGRVGGTGRLLNTSYLIQRVLVPVGCFLALVAGSLMLMNGQTSVLYYWVAVIILLLANASGNSWSLLVQLAILKRDQNSPN